jgi:hypothetical protein
VPVIPRPYDPIMTLSELRNAMRDYATRCDATVVSAHDAARVIGDAAAIEKMAATVKSLAALYPTCAVKGCNRLAYLETDHREDWSRMHATIFELFDRFCGHHHDLKTRQNWALVEGRGKRAFVPPDDPRHPRNAHGPPVAA